MNIHQTHQKQNKTRHVPIVHKAKKSWRSILKPIGDPSNTLTHQQAKNGIHSEIEIKEEWNPEETIQ